MNQPALETHVPTLAEICAPIGSQLDAVRVVFDRELVSDVPAVRALCEKLRTYQGKMLRPALLLLCGKAVGDLNESHTTLAAVIEMIHLATLVHDDVLDDADMRRQSPTLSASDGNVSAVLLGDYLISHAYHLCSSLDSQFAARRVGATTNTVCEGELLQNDLAFNPDVDEKAYFDIIERKTAALTATACELGAYCSEADSSVCAALSEYGKQVGIAFQIVDDVLDIVGDRHLMGKSQGLDLAGGKLTLPTIHGLQYGSTEMVRALRGNLLGKRSAKASDVREWLTHSGSIQYSLDKADAHVARAMDQLDLIPLGEASSALSTLASFITDRVARLIAEG